MSAQAAFVATSRYVPLLLPSPQSLCPLSLSSRSPLYISLCPLYRPTALRRRSRSSTARTTSSSRRLSPQSSPVSATPLSSPRTAALSSLTLNPSNSPLSSLFPLPRLTSSSPAAPTSATKPPSTTSPRTSSPPSSRSTELQRLPRALLPRLGVTTVLPWWPACVLVPLVPL